MFLCLSIIFLCVCGCANQPKEEMQTAGLMITGPGEGNDYLFNVQSDGTIKLTSFETMTPKGFESLRIEDFSEPLKVKSKTLSFKERTVVNQLITDIKENADINNTVAVEDAIIIIAEIDGKDYLSTYHDDFQYGDIAVQNLAYKLVELCSVKIAGE